MLNILIVDDSEVDRLLMDGLLKRSIGFEVIWAENGRQAIERFKDWNIDLVITDLQMPEVDGLELVRVVRKSHPQVPIVLTTGKGSEDIAAQALNEGAAGYVPKSHLSTMLVPTVRGILNILKSQRHYGELLQRADGAQFNFTLNNDPRHFPPLIDFCEKLIRGMVRMDRIERLRIAIALEHALHNALYRGNLEISGSYKFPIGERITDESLEFLINDRMNSLPYRDRKIYVQIKLTRTSFTARIRDEGPGFDPQAAVSWDRCDSRGMILMNSFMDEVRYNEQGNEVAIRRLWPQSRRSSQGNNGSSIAAAVAATPSATTTGRLLCQKTGSVQAVTTDKFMIGRRDTCHLVLPFQSIADNHCLLLYEDGWFVKNLDDEYQTMVNDQPVQYHPLRSGDKLTIGSQEFCFECE